MSKISTRPTILQYYIDRCDSLQTMERLLMERWTKQMNEGASGGGMKASSVRREQYEDVEQKIRCHKKLGVNVINDN